MPGEGLRKTETREKKSSTLNRFFCLKGKEARGATKLFLSVGHRSQLPLDLTGLKVPGRRQARQWGRATETREFKAAEGKFGEENPSEGLIERLSEIRRCLSCSLNQVCGKSLLNTQCQV